MAGVEAELNDRWRGAWVIVEVGATSDCTDAYTDNEVLSRRTIGKGDHRFEPGELAVVNHVRLRRKQVEVLLDLVEPILAARRDGPFTLYDQLSCRIELELPIPSGRKVEIDELDRVIGSVLSRHDGPEAARGSAAWNGRVRQPYPDDYQRTLADYEVWRAAQINLAVQSRIEESLEVAARLVDRLGDDPDFLAGFAEGIEAARNKWLSDNCERLLESSIYSFRKSPPKAETDEWQRGFKTGQELVFHLEIGRRLHRCFVPAPPPA